MNFIKRERLKKRMKQFELAKKCNVKQSFISKIESGKEKPSAQLIMQLSKYLDVCPGQIFCYFYCDNVENCIECEHNN